MVDLVAVDLSEVSVEVLVSKFKIIFFFYFGPQGSDFLDLCGFICTILNLQFKRIFQAYNNDIFHSVFLIIVL